jgi:hypothetical protein
MIQSVDEVVDGDDDEEDHDHGHDDDDDGALISSQRCLAVLSGGGCW